MPSAAELKERIEGALPGASAQVEDLTGGGDHFRAEVVSDRFAGLSSIDRHRLVYDVFDCAGIRVLVDGASLRYVDGSTVDYTESFMGAGFEVSNPNVVASCGCGSSFRVADEEPSCGASA